MYEINERTIDLMRGVIAFYLERQKLVAQAMLDVHPQPLYMCGTHILGEEIEPHVQRWLKKIDSDEDFERNWHNGIWQDEWRYHAYGLGCQLINIHSGEPVAWTVPHFDSYDQDSFMEHLNWRIAQTAPLDNVEGYSKWLHALYQYMLDQRLVVINIHQKWKLNL
jgi:hypothetical protein